MAIPDLPSRVLFQDALMLILDKPAGIAVHAGPKGGESLEDAFGELRFGYKETPKLAHRLDRDTSGCLVLGRNNKGIRRLGRLFETGHVEKRYWAIVHGKPPATTGKIDAPLKKKTEDRRSWWMIVDPSGQEALTEYRVLGSDGNISWVEFTPKTGRTHQIRIHAAHLGCPLVGDSIYGQADGAPLHLHSRWIGVPLYYPDKPIIGVEAPPPEHMRPALARCGDAS